MQRRTALQAVLLLTSLALPITTLAQGTDSPKASAGKLVPPAQVFDKMLAGEEKEIVPAAEAMPADKFNFAPSSSMGLYTGVRTFSSQVKHLTAANYGMFRAFDVPGGKTRADLDKLTSRDEIIQNLKDSYAYAHKCIATITPQNAFADLDGKGDTRVGLAAFALAHANDHYGQMVEYLRMNGIIPPASRK